MPHFGVPHLILIFDLYHEQILHCGGTYPGKGG